MAVERRTTKSGKVRWYTRYYDPTGREHAKTFDTKREAERYLADQRATLSTRKWVDPRVGSVRLEALWEQYAHDLLPLLADTTQTGYRAAWRDIAPVLGNFPVGRLRHQHVQQFVTDLRKGPATVRKAHRVLSLVLKYAVANRYVADNVADGARLPAAPPARDRILTKEELLKLADAIGERGRGQVLVMGLAGLRWGEVAGLRAGAVDLDANRISIVETVPSSSGKLQTKGPKSKESIRRIAIPSLLAEDLRERLRDKSSSDLAFPAPRGGIDRVGNFVRRTKWKENLAKAGIAHATPHDLRRTFGSLARLGGADLRYVQKAMGHASITTTSRIYAHLYDTEPDNVAQGIDRVMQAHENPPDHPPVQA